MNPRRIPMRDRFAYMSGYQADVRISLLSAGAVAPIPPPKGSGSGFLRLLRHRFMEANGEGYITTVEGKRYLRYLKHYPLSYNELLSEFPTLTEEQEKELNETGKCPVCLGNVTCFTAADEFVTEATATLQEEYPDDTDISRLEVARFLDANNLWDSSMPTIIAFWNALLVIPEPPKEISNRHD